MAFIERNAVKIAFALWLIIVPSWLAMLTAGSDLMLLTFGDNWAVIVSLSFFIACFGTIPAILVTLVASQVSEGIRAYPEMQKEKKKKH